ncbi:MAG: hypothetical protein ACREJ3_13500, partial [Polyangiaceae bacterium]
MTSPIPQGAPASSDRGSATIHDGSPVPPPAPWPPSAGIAGSFPPLTPRATAKVSLRFEDVTQDGRLVLEALPTALGPTVFRGLLQ